MVIQPNMSPKEISEVWEQTENIFNEYEIPLEKESLENIVEAKELKGLLKQLNQIIGSSSATCIKGG